MPEEALARRVRAIAVALAVLLAGCAAPGEAPRAEADRPAGPAWSFVDTEGVERNSSAALGQPVLLFFMATWCSTCASKAPIVRDVVEDTPALQAYSVTIDPADGAEDLRAWQERHAQPWPHGRDPSLAILRDFGIVSQSSFVVLDAEGRIVAQWSYPGPGERALREAVAAAA